MAHIKLVRGALFQNVWREKGEVLEMPSRLAEEFVKVGAGVPVAEGTPAEHAADPSPPIEDATNPPRGEQAVSPRHRHNR